MDKELEAGTYFENESQRRARKYEAKKQKQQETTKQRKEERAKVYEVSLAVHAVLATFSSLQLPPVLPKKRATEDLKKVEPSVAQTAAKLKKKLKEK